jgi:hypothetical protein
VRKENSEPIDAGGLDDPAKQFREFAAECVELAQTAHSPEKREVYLEMARTWDEMALRRKKRLQRDWARGISLLNEYFISISSGGKVCADTLPVIELKNGA